MSVTAGVSGAALATRANLRGGIGETKVGRYWPGKAPKWAEEAEEDDDGDDVSLYKKKVDGDLEVSRNKDDPRLRRLAQTTRTENREQVRAEHQRVRQAAEVISTEEELRDQDEEEEDVDALEERRSRIREKNRERAREEADLHPVEDEEEEELLEEEEESEYETDSEDEWFGITMIKPVFVPKAGRDTIAEREKMEAKEEALEELAKKKLEMRKIETKQIVVEEVRKDEEIRKNVVLEDANVGDVDTDDETNEAEDYEVWKTREVARIKIEKDAKEAMSREKEEIEKLRNMTEQERKEWERDNTKPSSSSSSAKPKRQWNFMQRYYHKGAFFQEAESVETNGIYQRDYSAPTGEDRFDKSKLPQVMQVKKFGRSGRTKWTHLSKEDTTYSGKNKKDEDTTKDLSDPWVSNVFLRRKYNKRMAAMDAPIERPMGSKKMKVW